MKEFMEVPTKIFETREYVAELCSLHESPEGSVHEALMVEHKLKQSGLSSETLITTFCITHPTMSNSALIACPLSSEMLEWTDGERLTMECESLSLYL